jgi:hypothetical protein
MMTLLLDLLGAGDDGADHAWVSDTALRAMVTAMGCARKRLGSA